MEISVISDAVLSIACPTQASGVSNFFLNRPHNAFSLTDASSDQPPQSSAPFHISGVSRTGTRTLTKHRLRKARRVKRKIHVDGGGEDYGFFFFFEVMVGIIILAMDISGEVAGVRGGILVGLEEQIGKSSRINRNLIRLLISSMRFYVRSQCRIACILPLREWRGLLQMGLVIGKKFQFLPEEV